MLRDDARYCDGCGQKLPPKAMLAQQKMSREEAASYRSDAPENDDGTVTIDLCLACRIRRANLIKHEY
jgi:hypothetical protein